MAGSTFRGVALVGFMGAGKTVVGKALAAALGAEFWELDERVEVAAGMSIPDIFTSRGEDAFRKIERVVVRDAVSRPGRVIATGGGAFVDPRNREALRGYGPVVFLDAAPETVLARLGGDRTRPLLAGEEREVMVRNLMAKRRPAYAQADIIVATDGKSVDEVAREVAARLAGGKGVSR